MPLAVRLTAANRNDSQEALALVDAIPRCTAKAGDRGTGPTPCLEIAATMRRRFDADCGRGLSCRGWPCVAPRMGVAWADGRWVVERTFAWLNQFRRLRVRYDKRADIHQAFLSFGCALICWQSLRKTWTTG
jgi:transposase